MQKDNGFFFIILIGLFCIGCSLDYSSANIADDLEETIPETVFINFSQVQVKNGKIKNKMLAKKAESYTKKKKMVLEHVQFFEFDENGNIITEGKADLAELNTETDDAEMSGDIYFYSYTEETAIYAETLFWNDKEQTLHALPDEMVILKKDDGSYIEGKGFRTDFKLKEINFTQNVKGSYISQ